MSNVVDEYLKCNEEYWSAGYPAENVESFVFRPYGRIFKYEFGLDGSRGERLLDFGCGQGAALRFYKSKGFDVYGVDISEPDITACKTFMPDVDEHFEVCDSKPKADDMYFGGGFDVITTIQSLFFYTDDDLKTRIDSLYEMMNPGGILYATMIGPKHYLYDHSTEYKDGLRKVDVDLPRIKVKNYFINFTMSKEQLVERFQRWDKKHVGFYDAEYREGEGGSFHWTYVGQKPLD